MSEPQQVVSFTDSRQTFPCSLFLLNLYYFYYSRLLAAVVFLGLGVGVGIICTFYVLLPRKPCVCCVLCVCVCVRVRVCMLACVHTCMCACVTGTVKHTKMKYFPVPVMY